MPKDTADIFGATGTNFTLTLDAAEIVEGGAKLIVTGQPEPLDLKVSGNGREVTVLSLPAGDSVVSLALIWSPGEDKDATIDVGTVTPGTGTVEAANPRHTIDVGETPGEVELFGE
jgi:hypothetical protein